MFYTLGPFHVPLNFRRCDLKTCKIPALMTGDRLAGGQGAGTLPKSRQGGKACQSPEFQG
jgi:hypothetical protein